MNNLKNPLLILVLALTLVGCGKGKEEPIPNDVIPPEKMEKVLVDIQLMEGALIYERSQGNVSDSLRDLYFNIVFEKHAISISRYEESLKYYKDHLKTFEEMYNKVVKQLETMK